MLSINPNLNTVNNNFKKQNLAFKALPIDKISSSAHEANRFWIQAKMGKMYPQTPENEQDLLTAISNAKSPDIKNILTRFATNVWGMFKK